MTIRIEKDYEAMSKSAAEYICSALDKKPDLLLCTASGFTPTGTYKELAKKYNEIPSLFDHLRVMKLDEWVIDDLNDPSTCETYLKKNLLTPLHIDHHRYFACDSNPVSTEHECQKMNEILEEQGPIDICILGLGINGHLGFNEPADKLHLNWHCTNLTTDSLAHSMLRSEIKPKKGISLGIGGIFGSKRVLLLVSGKQKQEVLKYFFEQKISTYLPASLLWLHQNATLICDEEAIGLVEKDKLNSAIFQG